MLDWLFTPTCAACRAVTSDPLCDACSSSLDPLGPSCPYCAEPTDEGAACRRCLATRLPIEQIASPWRFGGQLATAIRRYKLAGHTYIARTIAPLWAPLVAAAAEPDGLVVPVPSHWTRRLRRGFDHVWLLALHACRAANIAPPIAALRRIRGGPPQSTLSADDRRSNLDGAFRATNVAGRSVVLVDDVATTGSTLAACARALTDAGATRVVGIVLARATSARE